MKPSWVSASIKEIFEIKYGKGLPEEYRNSSGSVSVYGSNGVIGKHDKSITAGPTIVLGRKGSVGEVNLSTESCWPIDTTYFIDSFPCDLPPKYWMLYLKSLKIGQHDKSTAIPGINRDDVYGIKVPLPPLNEQRRIVAKLEKLLSKVDACKERLEKIPTILKRFRQSVLAAACSGRLTADWREKNPDVEPAEELLKRIREKGRQSNRRHAISIEKININNSFELPASWSFATIEELEIFIGSGITPRGGKSVYRLQGIPFIRSQNVRSTGLVLKGVAYITSEMHNRMARTKLKDKDVLLNITGASIGRATYIPENFGEGNVNQHVCIIRLQKEVLPEYTTLYLNSPIGQDLIFSTQCMSP